MKRIRYIVVCILCAVCFNPIQAQLNTDRITSIGRNALYFEDYVLSIQYFNQVIKRKPYLAEPYLLRAIAKMQLADYSGALLDCNAAIENNPFLPGAYYTRGYAYRQLDQLDQAEADFTTALQFSPENKTYLTLRADVRAKKEHYDDALLDIDYLLSREPLSPSVNFEKGVICLGKKDTTCALNCFQQTVRYDSQNPANWSALGLVQLMQDNNNDALLSLNKAINLGSKWSGDYINRGIIYYHQHNYQNALADLDKAVIIDPINAQTYYNRGMLRAELGDYNRALEDFNTAIDLEPNQTDLRYQRAVILLKLRQWKAALDDINALINTYPYFLPSYYLAAQAKTALGDRKAAYQYRQQALDLEQHKDSLMSLPTEVRIAQTTHPDKDRRKEFSARLAQNQTDTLFTLREIATLDVSVTHNPASVTALNYFQTANDYAHQRDFTTAIEYYTKAIDADNDFAEAYFNRGLTRIYINHIDEGIADLSKAGELGISQAYDLIPCFR